MNNTKLPGEATVNT